MQCGGSPADYPPWSTPTCLREGLLKDALVQAAERGAQVLEVGEAELLVPQLGQTVRWLGRRRGRGLGRRRLLGGLLEAERLGGRVGVAAHLETHRGGN